MSSNGGASGAELAGTMVRIAASSAAPGADGVTSGGGSSATSNAGTNSTNPDSSNSIASAIRSSSTRSAAALRRIDQLPVSAAPAMSADFQPSSISSASITLPPCAPCR